MNSSVRRTWGTNKESSWDRATSTEKAELVELADKSSIVVWRIGVAFILTPLLISLAVAVVMPLYGGLPNYIERVLRTWPLYMIFGALPPTIVLGIPAFLILKKVLRLTVINCALAGAFIATVPWFLVGFDPGGGSAWVDGQATVIDGRYTAYGWLQFGQSLLFIAGAGAVGGVVFWSIAAAHWPGKNGSS